MKKWVIGSLLVCAVIVTGSYINNKNNTREHTKVASSDEMHTIYKNGLPEIEKLFTDNKIEYKELENADNSFEGKTIIEYVSSDNNAKVIHAKYGLVINENKEAVSIIEILNIKNEIKGKEFKFEDTNFYKIHKILIPEIDNIANINNQIKERYKSLDIFNVEDIPNGKTIEKISIGKDNIEYTLIINR